MSLANLHLPSFQAYSEENETYSKLPQHINLLQHLQTVDLKQYRKKLRLLFNNLPQLGELSQIYNDLSASGPAEEWSNKELLLLQCLVLCLKPTADLQMNEEQWEYLASLMPRKRSPEELIEISQQFVSQSAYQYPWTEEEDNLLSQIIMRYQQQKKGNKWSRITQEFNDLSQSKHFRQPKQCRERWGNKLDPTINRQEWTDSEDLLFLELALQYGRRWAELSVRLSAITENQKRTEFSMKHRFRKLINFDESNYSTTKKSKKSMKAMKQNYQIASDWSSGQAIVILQKIQEFKIQCAIQDRDLIYQISPLRRRMQMNNTQLVIIKGNKIIIIDSAHLQLSGDN